MSRTFWTAAVSIAVVAFSGLKDSDSFAALGNRTYLRISGVTTTTTPDGVRMKRASNAPVTTLAGQPVGTAWVTSFEAHPGLEDLPTVIEITAGGTTAIIGGLTSATGTFRQTLGYSSAGGSLTFHGANYVAAGDTEYLAFLEQLTPTNESPGLPLSLSHGFQFTQNRVDRQIGDTGLTFRPGNQWFLSPASGQLTRLGDNPSMGFTNLTAPPHSYNVNYLRLPDQQSGAIVVCFGIPSTCGVKAIGDYEGYYGRALSLAVGILGVVVDAASETVLTYRDSSVPPNPPGCPPGRPLPSPRNVIGVVLGEDVGRLSWDSVECASHYIVRVVGAEGTAVDFNTQNPRLLLTQLFAYQGTVVSVAAVAPDGTVGAFSEAIPFNRLIP